MTHKLPASLFDVALKIRPGALADNAALLLDLVKAAARAGSAEIVVPADFIRGGDCGSLNDHPAFQAALAAAQEKFLKSVAKVKGAPRITFTSGGWGPSPITDAGPDPRFPFGGRPGEVFSRQVVGLARRLAAIGCRHAVVGLSGGLDSALALLVTVTAFDLLGLGRAGVHVFTMPGFGTTKRTRGNAEDLAEGLGLKLETIDITSACRQHFRDIGQSERVHDVTYENAQARERTQILMDKANQVDGIVVGTGDMSEIALGWCTYNGDHMSMFGLPLVGRGEGRGRARRQGAPRHHRDAGEPRAVAREAREDRAEDRGQGGPLRAARLLPLALRRRAGRARGDPQGREEGVQEAVRRIRHRPVAGRVLPPVLLAGVQAELRARRRAGFLRLPVAVGLARAKRHLRTVFPLRIAV